MYKSIVSIFFCVAIGTTYAQQVEPIEITDAWLAKIEQLAPAEPTVKNKSKKKVLVVSKATGFYHWTIPHNSEVLKIIAD
ncbi:MAG: ThuA domain-containing protein, partial [Pricia sp.]